MKLIVLFVVLAALLDGCSIPSVVVENKEAHQPSSNERLDSDASSTIDTLIRTELVHQWAVDIQSSDQLKTQFISRLDTTRNIHWPEQIDTILYYTTEKSAVNIYRTPERDILLDSDLFDSDIALSSKIKIGVSKDALSSILSKKNLSNTVLIGEIDTDKSFTFYFKDNRLYHIHFNCYID